MVLRWRPSCVAICEWLRPCVRNAERLYLSPEVSWWYFIVISLVLADGRNRKYLSSPLQGGCVLHLVYDSATSNTTMQRTRRTASSSVLSH